MPAQEIPAPVGGWNARDALSAMAPTDAVQMLNWFPQTGVVTGRGGSLTKIADVSGTADSVESLVAYEGDSTTKLIAAANGTWWDVTSLTGSVSIQSGFTSDLWQSGAFDNNTVLVNGADTPQVYNGSTMTDMVATGPTLTNLIGVIPFKGRAFYWEKSSSSFWYAAAGSFQGTLTEFPLATFTQHGGTIFTMLSWTRDAGDGVDDFLVIIFNTGETLVYQGDDPGDSLRWSMVGRWLLGKPYNIRAHGRYQSTEIIGTQDCFLGIDEAIQNTPLPDSFGGRIVRAAGQAAKSYGNQTGWAFLWYAAGNQFIVNVPKSATQSVQYVKNTNTGAWTQFTGWNARCFAIYGGRLYFGTGDGALVLADTNNNDPIQNAYSDDGNAIVYDAVTAYQKFGEPGSKVQLTAGRVVTTVFDPSALSLNAFGDYRVKAPLPPLAAPVEQAQGMWDVSDWDEDYWAGDDNDPNSTTARPTLRPISSPEATSFAIALSVRYQSRIQNPQWYSTEFVFKQGGIV